MSEIDPEKRHNNRYQWMFKFALLTPDQEKDLARIIHDNQYEQTLITPNLLVPAYDYFKQRRPKLQQSSTLEELQQAYCRQGLVEPYIAEIAAYLLFDSPERSKHRVYEPIWVPQWRLLLNARKAGKHRGFSPETLETLANPSINTELKRRYMEMYTTACPAFWQMVHANYRLVIRKAYPVAQSHQCEVDELIDAGIDGLMHAVAKFDYRKNNKFCTYAEFYIRAYIEREAKKILHVNINTFDTRAKLERLRKEIGGQQGRPISNEELLEYLETRLEYTPLEIRQFQKLLDRNIIPSFISLEQPYSDNPQSTLSDLLEDPKESTEAQERRTSCIGFSERVKSAMEKMYEMSEKTRVVIIRRFGLYGVPEESLQAIGNTMTLSRERIRQIERKGLEKLRKQLRE